MVVIESETVESDERVGCQTIEDILPQQELCGEQSIRKNRSTENRVFHIPRRFVAEEWGGTETVILEIARRQQASGWHPEIVTSQALSPRRTEKIGGVPVSRFDYTYPFFGLSNTDKTAMDKKGGNLISPGLFAHLMRAPNVRLFHAHALKRLGGEVRTAARLRSKPYVVSVHGGVFDVPESEQEMMLRPIRRKFEWGRPIGALLGSRRVLEDADHVICVGESELEQAQNQLSHDRVTYLPNGVNSAQFASGDGMKFRRRHGIPQDAFVILNVSRIDAQKNQLMLLEAFDRFRASQSNSHLFLIGPVTQPDYALKIQDRIKERGLMEHVHVLPGFRHSDSGLVDAYQGCDVFALASTHEPFGIVVLEAWSAGKPVLVSRVGGLKSLVRKEQTGLFFEPNTERGTDEAVSGLKRYAKSFELRRCLGALGREEAKHVYDWSKINRKLEGVYAQAEGHARCRYGKGK